MRLDDLDTFVRVADAGSLAAVARALGVPRSTISRRLTRLEEALGVDLLVRGPRRVRLTAAGQELQARSGPSVATLREVAQGLRAGTPRGTLRLTAPPDLADQEPFLTLLERFRRRWPEVVLDVDLSARVVDLVGEGFDLAIRPGTALPDTDELMVRSLGTLEVGIWAAPNLLEGRPPPTSLADLRGLPWVCLRHVAGRPIPLLDADGREFTVVPEPAVVLGTHMGFIARMVRAGLGLGLIPQLQAATAGLVRLLPALSTPPGRLALVWPRQRFLLPRVRAFIDAAVEAFEPLVARSGETPAGADAQEGWDQGE